MRFNFFVSFVQIYNEKLFDLFQDKGSKTPLQIREDKYSGVFVEGLSEYIVSSKDECLVLLQ